MTTETTPHKSNANWNQGFPCKIPFEQINEPGCYVCNWSGHLLRVPDDGIAPGRSPKLNFVGGQPLYVTKICDDPYCTVTKARMLASNWDINVNF